MASTLFGLSLVIIILIIVAMLYQNQAQAVKEESNVKATVEQFNNNITNNSASSTHQAMDESDPSRYTPESVNSCFPKDRLNADDLLPKDAANLKWSQVNPSGQGGLESKNFLSAGYHFGDDTVGSSLRNASHDLRSTPANPQNQVSPWLQSTIEPDLHRRPLEIN